MAGGLSARGVGPRLPFISYVSFPSLDRERPLTVSGQLRVPREGDGPVPAVVVVHGSSGVDSRGAFYAEALNAAGIATLEIDLWAARGWLGGTRGRPQGVPETLPDAYGALAFLAGVPRIDAKRIGILGFSWGGVVAMLTATRPYAARHPVAGGVAFAAHVAHYPVCWVYNRVPGYEFTELSGAPVLIQVGELDSYDLPDTGRDLVAALPAEVAHCVALKRYPGATHAWDRLEPPITVSDAFSHLGRGGDVDFVPHPAAAQSSRERALREFRAAFKLG